MAVTPEQIAAHEARCRVIRDNPSLRRKAWLAGALWWLLDLNQYTTYLKIRAAISQPYGKFTLKWARRTGKTHLLILVVVEECIRHDGHRYNIAAATKESLAEFVWPAVHFILETCPDDLKPNVREAKGRVEWRKKSGRISYAVLAGCNDARSVERLRGPRSNGNVLEELGAMPDHPGLGYIQTSVLNPQLLTTDGWTLRAGTPPPSTGHEAAAIFQQAEADPEHYSYATLYDNPRLSPQQVAAYLLSDASDLGMSVEEYKASPDYRREWLALVETDPTLAVLPACTPERMSGSDGRPAVVREMPDVPLHRDRYVSMDLGFHPHFTHLLFGYWDYARQVLVIEDELARQRLNDTELAAIVRSKERERWGEYAEPFLRVADNNYPMTLAELAAVHGLSFLATAKDEKEAAVLEVNRWIREGKIAVHPRCALLIAQMQAAVWNTKRTEFAQSKAMGHFDAVDALIYLVRNVIPHVSRVPPGWGLDRDMMHWREQRTTTPEERNLSRAFGGF